MKIFDAYCNLRLRRDYKQLLIAQGLTITGADKLYSRMGIYISRIRGVNYDAPLLKCETEEEFKETLDMIFNEKWKGHMGYAEVPEHFYRYLDYLHYVSARGIEVIEGLDDEGDVESLNEPGRYEKNYINEHGKLKIILNPVLVRRLRGVAENSNTVEALMDTCRSFYPFLDETMKDSNWKSLLEDFMVVSKPRKDKAQMRNISVCFPGESRQVLEGTDCFARVAQLIGYEKLLNSNIHHLGPKIVVRTVPQSYKLYFRDIGNGLYLNLKGTTTEKYKTLRLLDSFFKLGLNLELCNSPVKKIDRRKKRKQAEDSPGKKGVKTASKGRGAKSRLKDEVEDTDLFAILESMGMGDLIEED